MSQMVKRKKSAVGVGSAETSSLLLGGQGLPPGGALGSANSDILVLSDGQDGSEIKRCPMCFVPIERDAGCAQMMCKRCKHVFCWFCLASLDVRIYLFNHNYFFYCRPRQLTNDHCGSCFCSSGDRFNLPVRKAIKCIDTIGRQSIISGHQYSFLEALRVF